VKGDGKNFRGLSKISCFCGSGKVVATAQESTLDGLIKPDFWTQGTSRSGDDL